MLKRYSADAARREMSAGSREYSNMGAREHNTSVGRPAMLLTLNMAGSGRPGGENLEFSRCLSCLSTNVCVNECSILRGTIVGSVVSLCRSFCRSWMVEGSRSKELCVETMVTSGVKFCKSLFKVGNAYGCRTVPTATHTLA